MKRITYPADDNILIYIFLLLFAILLLSFQATTRSSDPQISTIYRTYNHHHGRHLLDALFDRHHIIQ